MRQLVLASIALVLSVATTRAEDVAGEQVSALLRAAVAAYERGELDEAQRGFERAHALRPTARTLRGLGVVAFRRGNATLAYSLLTQSLEATEKPLTDELRARVQTLVAELEVRVARVIFALQPADAVLRIDGAPALYDAPGAVVLEPGEHEATLSAQGHVDARWTFAVVAGGAQQRDWRLDPVSPLAPAQVAQSAPPDPSTTAPAAPVAPAETKGVGTRRRIRAGYAALGVAAAGVIVSAIAIGLGTSRVNAIEAACRDPELGCTEAGVAAESERAHLQLLSGLAIGAGLVAGIGAISGTWLLVSGRPSEPAGAPSRRVQVTVSRSF